MTEANLDCLALAFLVSQEKRVRVGCPGRPEFLVSRERKVQKDSRECLAQQE